MSKKHAKFSASASERWINCPGSITLIEKAPPARSSKYADEGTTAHEVLEKLLKSKNPKAEAEKLKEKHPKEMVEHAITAADEIWRRAGDGKAVLIEEKVELSGVGFGTVDVAIIEQFGHLNIIDYKYGAGLAVEPKENAQFLYYAAAFLEKYNRNFSEVTLTVIQPRAFHHAGPIRDWITDIETVQMWHRKFIKGVKESEAPTPILKSGDHCRFCPAAVICPEIKNKALRQAQIDFGVIDGPVLPVVVPEPKSIAIPRLGTILNALDEVETWIAAVRDHAFHVLERGEKIPGWKLIPKRSTRHWIDEAKTKRDAKRIFGNIAFSEPELLSPAQLEKATKDKAWVDANTTNISSGLKVVKDTEPGVAVNRISQDFTVYTPE